VGKGVVENLRVLKSQEGAEEDEAAARRRLRRADDLEFIMRSCLDSNCLARMVKQMFESADEVNLERVKSLLAELEGVGADMIVTARAREMLETRGELDVLQRRRPKRGEWAIGGFVKRHH
ncbi:hypothetical protein HK097_006050, partial [Rhizophlyctis rosea]